MRLRLSATLLLAVTAACATGGRPGDPDDTPSIVGSYLLRRIDNRALPTYSPTEPNVTVLAGSLMLGNGGAFSMSLVARNSPQTPPAEHIRRGSYVSDGDSIITITPVDGSAPVTFRAARAGVQLTLRGEDGHRYEFVIR
jgi:hypothetical protein